MQLRNEHNTAVKEFKKICKIKENLFWKSKMEKLTNKYHTNDVWDAWKSFDQNIQNKELALNDGNKWGSYYRYLFNENRINSSDLDKLGSHLNNHKKSYNNTNYCIENYRPICVTSCFCMLFCLLLNERLSLFLTENKIISLCQSGFQNKARTTDHIFCLKSLVNKFVHNTERGKIYACFADFKKAYDTAWQEGLFTKFECLNVNGCFLDIVFKEFMRRQNRK